MTSEPDLIRRISSGKWPLEFSLTVVARFDRPVAAASASLEIFRSAGGERVERKVKRIDTSAGLIQRWHGSFESASITEPGQYNIVIHVDGVEPVSLPWRFERK
jgi:hypothetical protein